MVGGERIGIVAPVVTLCVLTSLAIVAGLLTTGEEPDPADLVIAAADAAHRAGTAHMVLTFDATGEEITVDGVVDFGTGAAELEVAELGSRFRLRTIDGTTFLHLPGLLAIGEEFEWVGVPSDQAVLGIADFAYLPNGSGFVEILRGVVGEVEVLGPATVNGYDTHGFEVSVDMDEVVEWVSPPDRERIAHALLGVRSLELDVLPLRVWLDKWGLPVRVVLENAQMDYTQYGVDVDISEPPADVTVLADSVGGALRNG